MRILIIAICCFIGLSVTAQEEVISADQLYNKGNELYNGGSYGDAVFYYERALLLDPMSSDIKINLQLAKERLDADIVDLDAFFLAQWWKGLTNIMNPGTWKILTILLFLAFVLFMYYYWLRENKMTTKRAYLVGGILLPLCLLTILAGQSRYQAIFDNEYGVLGKGSESLYLAPDLVSEKTKDVTNGVKVKILDQNGNWFKVSAMDSEQGWIEKSKVRLLHF